MDWILSRSCGLDIKQVMWIGYQAGHVDWILSRSCGLDIKQVMWIGY